MRNFYCRFSACPGKFPCAYNYVQLLYDVCNGTSVTAVSVVEEVSHSAATGKVHHSSIMHHVRFCFLSNCDISSVVVVPRTEQLQIQ